MTAAGRTLWPAPFLDQRGNRRAGLAILVYEKGKGPAPDGDDSLVLAQLYTDDALTVPRNQTTSPVVTDADGNETSIKAAPGSYDAYVGGETIPFVVVDISAGAAVATVAADLAALESALPGTYVKSALVTATDAATVTFDLTAGTRQKVTLGGNRTLAVTGDTLNPLFTIVLQTGAGGFAPTWWAGIAWQAGAPPTVTTTSNRRDVFSFIRLGAGDYLGFIVAQNIAGPPTAPAAPTSIVATAGNATADVAFTPGSSNGAARDGCRITPYIGATAQTPQVFATTATTQTVTGLTNGVTYTFKVEDHNAVGYSTPLSAASNSVTPSNITAPPAPTIGTATAGAASATVTHTPNGNGGSAITGCRITPYIAGVAQTAQTFMDTATTHNVTGLTNGTVYTFKVALINIAGPGADSAASNSVTPAAAGVTFVNSASNPSAGGWLLFVPAGTAVGDLMIVAGCLLQSGAFTMTPPAGWTSLDVIEGAGGTYNPRLRVWTRVATSGDVAGGVSYTWTSDSPARTNGMMVVLHGQAVSSPINAYAFAASVAEGTSAVAPTVTSTVDGCRVVRFFAGVDSAGGDDAPTCPATSRISIGNADHYLGCGASDAAQPTAGATGTATATFPQASSWATATIAVKP